jgi:peptide deformylase
MESAADIRKLNLTSLHILHYPDPRLKRAAADVEAFDAPLRRLAERMFEILFAARGVGLAAAQVGVGLRMFVSSPAVQEDDRHVYVNPRVLTAEGQQEEEEGCLSVPNVTSTIKRLNLVTIEAFDLDGAKFQETGQGLLARIFQHEIDHLDGMLVIDRMGSLARLSHRRTLKELEEKFTSRP